MEQFDQPLRLLFVGFNSRYINPTNSLLPAMLKMAVDAEFYGPGFTDSNVLTQGLESFVDQHGPFDFLATTSQLCVASDPVGTVAFLHRYAISSWERDDGMAFVSDVSAFMKHTSHRRICFLTDLDVYSIGHEIEDSLREHGDIFVGWGEGFSEDMDSLVHIGREEFYKRKASSRPIGLWHQFVLDERDSFINLGHFVGLDEFAWTPLRDRAFSANVPGQLYARRRDALAAISASGKMSMPSQRYRKIFSLADRMGLNPYANPYLQKLYGLAFTKGIQDSRFVFTEGSGYQRPLRKFFEIPALGSVLLCVPCAGFENLGFIDGVNAMVVDERRLPEQIQALVERSDLAQSIADSGRDLIWKSHSLVARSQQFRICLAAIAKGEYSGSGWTGGEFHLNDRHAA